MRRKLVAYSIQLMKWLRKRNTTVRLNETKREGNAVLAERFTTFHRGYLLGNPWSASSSLYQEIEQIFGSVWACKTCRCVLSRTSIWFASQECFDSRLPCYRNWNKGTRTSYEVALWTMFNWYKNLPNTNWWHQGEMWVKRTQVQLGHRFFPPARYTDVIK